MSRHLAAVSENPSRVVLYRRVSALMGRGGEEFHSPDTQLAAMHRVTAGMQEVAVIDDIDVSGRTFSREGLDQVRRLVETGSIDVLAVYNLSRLGRNVLEALQFLKWLAEHQVTIISASEHIDTSTPSGELQLTLLLGLAQMRSKEIGDEWSRIIGGRAKSGKPHGNAPVGYRKTERGTLEPDPALGPVVAQAFAAYGAYRALLPIQRTLRAATGLALSRATFKRMLRNGVYRGRVRVRTKSGVVEKPGAHEPLVDEQTWERVQRRLARDARTPQRLLSPAYSLSGLVRCGVCNGAANHSVMGGKPRLSCRTQVVEGGCGGCGRPAVAEVEAEVLRRIEAYAAELTGDVAARKARAARATRAQVDARTVEQELTKTRQAMAKTTERWARGQLADSVYDETMRSLQGSEAELAVTLAGLRDVAEAPAPEGVVSLVGRLLELWPRLDAAQHNAALRDLVASVTIAPAARWRQPVAERITVQWR